MDLTKSGDGLSTCSLQPIFSQTMLKLFNCRKIENNLLCNYIANTESLIHLVLIVGQQKKWTSEACWRGGGGGGGGEPTHRIPLLVNKVLYHCRATDKWHASSV